MIIEKIINNNIVLTHDHKSREIIAMGKGIGFGRKKGDTVSESEIEKIFKINENEMLLKFQDMIADIPIERLYRNEMLHDEYMIFEDMMREKYPGEFDCGKKLQSI